MTNFKNGIGHWNGHAGAPRQSLARRTGAAGFAYLWTLMLVAFLGVGLVIMSEIYSTSLQREKEAELLFIGRQFRDAIGRYYEASGGGANHQYPLKLEDLLKDPRFPNPQRYLRHVYVDPMTGKAEWGMLMQQGRIVGIYSMSEKKPIKQGNFDVGEVSFADKESYSDWEFTYPISLSVDKPKKNGDGTTAVDPGASATVPAAGDAPPPGKGLPPSGAPQGKDGAPAGKEPALPIVNQAPTAGGRPDTL
jgi:hypothetical protein